MEDDWHWVRSAIASVWQEIAAIEGTKRRETEDEESLKQKVLRSVALERRGCDDFRMSFSKSCLTSISRPLVLVLK